MMLKAKPEMRPLQSGPVIFTNWDLILFPLALADTKSSSWYRFLSQNHSMEEHRVEAGKFMDVVTTAHAGQDFLLVVCLFVCSC